MESQDLWVTDWPSNPKTALDKGWWVQLSTPGMCWVDGQRWERGIRGDVKLPLDDLQCCQIPQLPRPSSHTSTQLREAEQSFHGRLQPWLVATASRWQQWVFSRLPLLAIKPPRHSLQVTTVRSTFSRLQSRIHTQLYKIAVLCPLTLSPHPRAKTPEDRVSAWRILVSPDLNTWYLVNVKYWRKESAECHLQKTHFLLPASEIDKVSSELTTVSWPGCSLPSLSIDGFKNKVVSRKTMQVGFWS